MSGYEVVEVTKDIPKDVRGKSLHPITMVKEKRDVKIKTRACSDERKQRRYISKEKVP